MRGAGSELHSRPGVVGSGMAMMTVISGKMARCGALKGSCVCTNTGSHSFPVRSMSRMKRSTARSANVALRLLSIVKI